MEKCNKLTIDKFINCFNAESGTDQIHSLDSASGIASIDINNDIFIKLIEDEALFPALIPKIEKSFGNCDGVNLFTWVEIENKFSFWFFPVLFFKNNDSSEMIENTKSIISFRMKVIDSYNKINLNDKVDAKINIGILGGKYSDSFKEVSKKFGGRDLNNRALLIKDREAEILMDNIKSMDLYKKKKLEICLLSHKYPDKLNNLDVFIVPDGFVGNLLYRAWISMGFVKKAATLGFASKKMLPLYIGGAISDSPDLMPDKVIFANAVKKFKNLIIKEYEMNIK